MPFSSIVGNPFRQVYSMFPRYRLLSNITPILVPKCCFLAEVDGLPNGRNTEHHFEQNADRLNEDRSYFGITRNQTKLKPLR